MLTYLTAREARAYTNTNRVDKNIIDNSKRFII